MTASLVLKMLFKVAGFIIKGGVERTKTNGFKQLFLFNKLIAFCDSYSHKYFLRKKNTFSSII